MARRHRRDPCSWPESEVLEAVSDFFAGRPFDLHPGQDFPMVGSTERQSGTFPGRH